MLASLLRFSLTQRVFVGILVLVVVALGIRAWLALPVDAFPDIAPTQVKIILKAPGMTAEEVEQQVTQLIETELLGIPDQQMLRSTTKYAITDITLDFRDGTDIYWARQQVSERLARVRDSLPDGISGGVAPMSTPLSEMFMFTVENPNMSLMERRHLLDWEIRPALRTVPGVADVNVLGGYARTFAVSPIPSKLAQAGISMGALAQAIRDSNLNLGAGRLEQGNDTLVVRTEGRIEHLQELANLVVKAEGLQIYRLADVAEVSIGHLARYGAVTRNGEETTEALIIALKNSNTGDVVAGVKQKLSELQPSLPPGTQINVFYDRATLIDTAIATISNALFQAIAIVVLLLALFLGNLRAAIVVSLSLPLSALATFYLMSIAGLSANLMSLGGLVIAIGMLVDSSVVVVENVVTTIEEKKGLPRLHLIYRACKDVALPVVSGTVIVLIVFSPLLTLTGLEGKLFTPVAITIVFAMSVSLLLSMTVVPIASSLLLGKKPITVPKWVNVMQMAYRDSLAAVIARPFVVPSIFVTLLFVSAVMFTFTGKTFMPVLDEGDIIVQLEKSPSISLTASVALDRQIQHALLDNVPEIRQIVARTGSDEIGLDPMGLNETDIFMELEPPSKWRFETKEALIEAIREVLKGYPGINSGFTQPIQMRVSEMLTGSSGDLSIKIFGGDIAQLASLAEQVATIARAVAGSVDVQTSSIDGGRFLSVKVHAEVAKRFGMSTRAFARYLRAQLEGLQVSEIIEGRKRTPIMFAADHSELAASMSVNDFRNKVMVMPDGRQAPLYELADVDYRVGPLIIERERGNRFAVVTSNVADRDIVGFVEELKSTLAEQLALPSGYRLAFGGEFESQQRATQNLLLVVPAALMLIMIILFSTFRSLPKAALILANIPFAIMGGLIALFVTGEYLSVPASVGLIALLGVAVLNGVVMVSYFEQTRLSVSELYTRIVQGSVRRLRPVLMTASTAMFGLMPLAFATGPGAEIQKPLAIVVIGGLLTSTVTTLYLLPLFYYYMERRHNG